MNRTLLLVALILTTIVSTTSPVLATRDPGPGPGAARSSGMSLYNYRPKAPTPPRVGQAGLNNQYADGMNLYEYVRSEPVGHMDPSGTFATREGDIGGGKENSFDYTKSKRYFYTAKCGWIDKSHFGWSTTYDNIVQQLQKQLFEIKYTLPVFGIKTDGKFLNMRGKFRGKVKNFSEYQIRQVALRMTFLAGNEIERSQFMAEKAALTDIVVNAIYAYDGSGWSLEDLPTNFLARVS
ncbi:MAG: hypothetical protein H8E53_09355 [Planctomycetes bacterium]|nr:hypothetical protein [Planctomycetota bacterium]